MTTDTLKTLLTDRWARFDHELFQTIEALTTAGKKAEARRYEHKRRKYGEAVGVTLKMLDHAMHTADTPSPLVERLKLCETIVHDMADLTNPCQLSDHFGGKVCEHIPNRIINSDVGCVFRLAMEYVTKHPNAIR